MVFHMKTTLVIADRVMRGLKSAAAKRGVTLLSLVEHYLREGLAEDVRRGQAPAEPWNPPTFHMGEPLVDISDRDALDRAMGRYDRVRR